MSACARSARLAQRLTRQSHIPSADLPAFLCPGVLRLGHVPVQTSRRAPTPRLFRSQPPRFISSSVLDAPEVQPQVLLEQQCLPSQCAGCGALSQIALKDEPGFYTLTRRSVKEYTTATAPQESREDAIIKAALENASGAGLDLGDFSKPSKLGFLNICVGY